MRISDTTRTVNHLEWRLTGIINDLRWRQVPGCQSPGYRGQMAVSITKETEACKTRIDYTKPYNIVSLFPTSALIWLHLNIILTKQIVHCDFVGAMFAVGHQKWAAVTGTQLYFGRDVLLLQQPMSSGFTARRTSQGHWVYGVAATQFAPPLPSWASDSERPERWGGRQLLSTSVSPLAQSCLSKQHISQTQRKSQQRLYVLRKLKSFYLRPKLLLDLYRSIVRTYPYLLQHDLSFFSFSHREKQAPQK